MEVNLAIIFKLKNILLEILIIRYTDRDSYAYNWSG